ncbi:hypothetical protein COU88_02985 [Candidatus Roizmanbacteria bacterium CG10_big_fil_rev_8_21_14_0_10_39_6]|uniref:5'-3' exonuclease domain-containing protein n=1 Tax=Candidatus Roizmanbacteria bacterium CG10_big_fil_rev_8_21_14_0_10_39_6 TaxID=1974853 RepID=A0A2M8KS97_9BACT|nr:MAG: hypothetical protein COU88_02985 [Candidatus Roizmanbacteria bacterium CG10_big_fil_rev_8_21_14_0_10_39_6]
MEKNQIKNALLIDGSAIVHRAYHALPSFTSSDGTPTNALYGFITMFLGMIDMFRPSYLAVCLDTPKPTFRKKILSTYQAQRPKAPDNLSRQFPLVIEFLKVSHIAGIAKEGFEADDVMATLADLIQRELSDAHIYIVTGDKDILQLVNDRVTVVMPRSGIRNVDLMDNTAVYKKLGIQPSQVVDYKTLAGDPSDNYSGVTGIGPKKASTLLSRYGTVENIYKHLDEIEVKTTLALKTYEKNALIAKKLAQLRKNVAIDTSIQDLVYTGLHTDQILPFLHKYTLKSIEKRIMAEKSEVNAGGKKQKNQLSFF